MIVQHRYVKYFLPTGFIALTLYPWIFIRSDVEVNLVLITHEKIHLKQQGEVTLLVFLLMYTCEWLWRWIIAISAGEKPAWRKAYRSIRFEKEAYLFENNPNYPESRKEYAWFGM